MSTTGMLHTLRQVFGNLAHHGGGRPRGAPPGVGRSKRVGDADLVDASKYVAMLMEAVDDHTEVRISFGNSILEYKSRFLPDRETGESRGEGLSSEYLRDRSYIRIAPTDPPEGSGKIQAGRTATLRFLQGGRVSTFQSSLFDECGVHGLTRTTARRGGVARTPSKPDRFFVRQTPDDFLVENGAQPLKIIFPDRIVRQRLQRGAVRVEYSDATGVTLHVKGEGGGVFEATLLDVSTGGCSFVPNDEVLPSEGSALTLAFRWGEERELVQRGILSKVHSKRGRVVAHVVFHPKTYESIREVGELVTYIERIYLRTRHNRSSTRLGGAA